MNGRYEISPQYVIVEAEKVEWRCSCILRPLLAMFTALGGCHIKVSGRHANSVHYIVDLQDGAILAHCSSSCHAWRRLRYDKETATIIDEEYMGPRPSISCPCTED